MKCPENKRELYQLLYDQKYIEQRLNGLSEDKASREANIWVIKNIDTYYFNNLYIVPVVIKEPLNSLAYSYKGNYNMESFISYTTNVVAKMILTERNKNVILYTLLQKFKRDDILTYLNELITKKELRATNGVITESKDDV